MVTRMGLLGLHQLRDRGLIRVRHVRCGDRPRVLRFLRGLSAESRAMRFLSASIDLDVEAQLLTDVDGVDRIALVATTSSSDAVIGHVGLARIDEHRGEVGLVIADQHRRRGIGSLLMHQIAEDATRLGMSTLEADADPANYGVMAFIRSMGAAPHFHSMNGVTRIELPVSTLRSLQRTDRAAA